MSRVILGILFVCALAACATEPTSDPEIVAPSSVDVSRLSPQVYLLSAGDVLRIEVYREPDLSITQKIEPDGEMSYPLLGRIQVAGRTASLVEREIRTKLSRGYLVDPDVRVSIVEFKPIYIDGQIKAPGEYAYKIGLTVQQAITRAGGPTQFASERVYLQRSGQGGDDRFRVTRDTQLLPGDIIIIGERMF